MPFPNWLKTKSADIASIQSWKSRQTVSFLSEETDIASLLNAIAKSAETEMHYSLCLLLSLMQVRNKVPPICDQPSMNGHPQSGIYDLTQTPSGEIISKAAKMFEEF